MIPIENIAPVKLLPKWRLLPERTSIQGRAFPIWPPNGRSYLHEGDEDEGMTQVHISIEESNMLHVSVSNSKFAFTVDQAKEYVKELLPSHYVDFIPQDEVNRNMLRMGINKRVAIGDELAPVQHFYRQL